MTNGPLRPIRPPPRKKTETCCSQNLRRGADDDIIDMTSHRFEYTGGRLSICGGNGDDVIRANNGENTLFGDAGNDRIIGASGVDVIVSGIGNNSMHCGADIIPSATTGAWIRWNSSKPKKSRSALPLRIGLSPYSLTGGFHCFHIGRDIIKLHL